MAVLTVILIAVAVAAIVGVAVAVVTRKQRGLRDAARVLRERSPDTPIFRIYGEVDFAAAVAMLAQREFKPRLFLFLLLVVHPDHLEFWDADTSECLVSIDSRQLLDVHAHLATVDSGASQATVFVTVRSDDDHKELTLPFSVMRASGLTFLAESIDAANRVADVIRQLTKPDLGR